MADEITNTTSDPSPPSELPAVPQPEAKPKVKPQPGARLKKGKPLPTAADLAGSPKMNVVVRITRKGHGHVHDGEGGRYDAGDEIVLPLDVAKALEGDGREALAYAEIIGKAE